MKKISWKWIKRQSKMLKYRPRMMWNSLYIRKDEFHYSLNMDIDAIMHMNDVERKAYMKNLCKRRDIAHNRDMERTDVRRKVRSACGDEHK